MMMKALIASVNQPFMELIVIRKRHLATQKINLAQAVEDAPTKAVIVLNRLRVKTAVKVPPSVLMRTKISVSMVFVIN